MTRPFRIRMDLLAFKPARRVLLSPAFPVALQATALVGVLGLALNRLGVGPGLKPEESLTLRKTNLTTLVVWAFGGRR